MTRKRLGAYRLEFKDERLTISRASKTRSLFGCLIAVALFMASYLLLFLSVLNGRTSYQVANLSLILGMCGVFALVAPFVFGSIHRVSLIIDRARNEIRDSRKKLSSIETIRQIVVLSREALVGIGAGMLHREQMVLYADGETGRIELATLNERADANQLADAISEFLEVPISFEQGDPVELKDANPDD